MTRPARPFDGGYRVPRASAPVDLRLSGNEGPCPDAALLRTVSDPEVLRRYPDAGPLRARLAARLGLDPDQVLVTAGGDDALDRCCRALLGPGREVVFPVPGFEMVRRYAELAGATVVDVPWVEPPFPTEAVLAAVSADTAMIVVTSPNNPTGFVTDAETLRTLSRAAPEALILVDLAYAEFADEDLTHAALALPNALVVRTVSKAFGLAGLRVGYAAGPAEIISWLASCGAPYPVSSVSLAVAAAALDAPPDAYVARVRDERTRLTTVLSGLSVATAPSQGNFVFAELDDPVWLRDAMASLGIGIRAFPDTPGLERAVRITCPGNARDLARVEHALATALAPEALLLDMDGVLVDVSGSYRQAIIDSAAAWGVTVDTSDIARLKSAGDANNDWVLTQRLLAAGGVQVPLDTVTATFERLMDEGLWRRERPLVPRDLLVALSRRLPLAIVTGRPRRDALRFLEQHDWIDLFTVVVCLEDGPPKPDPAPVRTALDRLGLTRAWMVGDTVDDVRAARAAGVVSLGIPYAGTRGDDLVAAGAARALTQLAELATLLGAEP